VRMKDYQERLEREGGLATVDASGVDPLDLPTRHDAAVVVTLQTQWEALQDETGRDVLQAAALLGEAAQIPRARLALMTGLRDKAEGGYPNPLEAALRALHELWLVEELDEEAVRLHPLVWNFVEEGISDLAEFSRTCFHGLVGVLWDVSRLDEELAERGVDAILADLRGAKGFLRTPEGQAAVVDDQRHEALVRTIDGEAHRLRVRGQTPTPGHALQQIHNRAMNLGHIELQRRIAEELDHRKVPWMMEHFPTGRESEALLRTLAGHTDRVLGVALTPDGRRAVSASYDGTLRVWDLESGQSVNTLEGHTHWVWGVTLTPDGRRAVSACEDCMLRVWDLKSGRSVGTLEGHTRGVRGVAVTPDGRRAVSASYDRTLRVWDLESGQCVNTLEGHTREVRGVAVAPGGCRAVSASADGTLRVWDLKSGQCVNTLEGHTGWVLGVALTPDGRRAVSASADRTLRVWDLKSGQCVNTLEGHNDWVRGVAVTPDERWAVSASYDRTLRVWDLESGEEVLRMDSGMPFTSCTLSGNELILAGDNSGALHWVEIRNL
jgi:WD40 repeat protein